MRKSIGKLYFKIVLWVLFLSLSGFVGKLVLFPAKVANTALDATVNTTTGVIEKTMNADNALFNYENFHNLYQGAKQQVMNIKSAEDTIDQLKDMFGEPSTWDKQTKGEYNLQMQNIEGYKMQYQRIVSEYNADSKKLNRTLFKDKNLPFELPLDYKELQ